MKIELLKKKHSIQNQAKEKEKVWLNAWNTENNYGE